MIVQLTPHPDFPSAVTAIEVAVVRSKKNSLLLTYTTTGRVGDVLVPEPAMHERTDELWRHTCFEAFVQVAGESGYYEFNLSPSTQWAAYAFDGYREGMRPAPVRQSLIAFTQLDKMLDMAAIAYPDQLPTDAPWRVAITAIIEERSGAKSYWALKHPPGKPDFHHADGFVLELPPKSAA